MGEDDMIGMWYWFEDLEEEQRKSEERTAKEREWRTREIAASKSMNQLIGLPKHMVNGCKVTSLFHGQRNSEQN